MKEKKPLSFAFIIIAIVLGVSIFKNFDFQKVEFEKPALAIVYLLCFVFCIYVLLKDRFQKK